MRYKTLMLFSTAAIMSMTAPVFAENVPGIPVSVIEKAKSGVRKPAVKVNKIKRTPQRSPISRATGADNVSTIDLAVEPGVNQMIYIAQNHINRIVTPFENPLVRTSTDAKTNVERNVVYLATSGTAPVTMFIADSEDEATAISLTLIPQKIPPIEIRTTIKRHLVNGMRAAGLVSQKAKRWEDAPLLDLVKRTMRTIALQKVPDGFSIRKVDTVMDSAPQCIQQGLSFNFKQGQVLEGNETRVFIGVVRNTSKKRIEIIEKKCAGNDTIGVTAWPRVFLKPNAVSEIYVMQSTVQQQGDHIDRPALIGYRAQKGQ